MRRFLLTLALMFSAAVQAQETFGLTRELKCSNAQFVINELTQKWGETPIWVGKTDHNTHVTLLFNKEKKSWTLVEYDARIACVLEIGEGASSPDIGT